MYQTLRNLRQKIVMLKIKLQPYTMNIIFIYNQYFNKMDKLLLNSVDTLGSVVSTYIVGLISLIIIGVSLLIILYRIVKWMSRLDDMMTSLVAQTYIQQQKEKEEAEGNDKNSLISIDDSSEIIEAKDATKVKKDDKNDNGGDAAQIGSTGDYAKIGSSGDAAKIGSSGYAAKIGSSGEHSVVMAAGHNSIAKAKIGSWITLAEWEYNDGVWVPICVKTEQVDGERIKADTFYKLIDGEFKEVDG